MGNDSTKIQDPITADTARVSGGNVHVQLGRGSDLSDMSMMDVEKRGAVTFDWFHGMIHGGHLRYFQDYREAVANANTRDIGIAVPATASTDFDRGVHLRIDGEIEGFIQVQLFECTSFTGGTDLVHYGFNGNYLTQNSEGALKATYKVAPTITGLSATPRRVWTFGGAGTNQTKAMTMIQNSLESILEPNKSYILRQLCKATTAHFTLESIFYEWGL